MNTEYDSAAPPPEFAPGQRVLVLNARPGSMLAFGSVSRYALPDPLLPDRVPVWFGVHAERPRDRPIFILRHELREVAHTFRPDETAHGALINDPLL